MCKIAFIVLHYLAYNDTCECVNSIIEFVGCKDYVVIVVDNNSPDDSYERLLHEYQENDKVMIVHNESNMGFAKGNNVGYRIAKYNLKADFIVLLNNDVCLFQKGFYEIVNIEYQETLFAVLGPMIITKDGMCNSNPSGFDVWSKEKVQREIKRQKYRELILKLHMDTIANLIKEVSCKVMNRRKNLDIGSIYLPKNNVQLHGSFLIFSKEYIDRFDGLDERTFMYFEEQILFLHLSKNCLLSRYSPVIAVYHKEDASTNMVKKSTREKKLFTIKNNLDSMKRYLDILEEYGD